MSNNQSPQILGTAPIGKLLVEYSLPAIIAMTVVSLYNVIDSIFIGHGVGAMAIAGLAITFPLMNLIIAFCTLVGVGAATISSIYMGQKDIQRATFVLHNAAILLLVNGLLVTIVTLIFLDPILLFFGASHETLPYARDFMQVILIANPIAYLFVGLNNLMRATGYPKKAMLSSFLTVAVNVIVAPIFIFVLDWGIRGAAMATALSHEFLRMYCGDNHQYDIAELWRRYGDRSLRNCQSYAYTFRHGRYGADARYATYYRL